MFRDGDGAPCTTSPHLDEVTLVQARCRQVDKHRAAWSRRGRKRGDERPIGRTKPRALLLTSQNRAAAAPVPYPWRTRPDGRGRAAAEPRRRQGRRKRGASSDPPRPGEGARGFPRPLRLLEVFWYSRARETTVRRSKRSGATTTSGRQRTSGDSPPENHSEEADGQRHRRIEFELRSEF
jgi:hypothetical protein